MNYLDFTRDRQLYYDTMTEWKSCANKKTYSKKRHAERIVEKVSGRSGKSFRAYKCNYCNGFHITKQERV